MFTEKHPVLESPFNKELYSNFIKKKKKKKSNTGAVLWILQNFWDHLFLRTSGNGCFYQMLFQQDQSIAILRKSQKLWISIIYIYKSRINSHIYNAYVKFTSKSWSFAKWKPVVFKYVVSSRSKNTGPVTRDHVKSSRIRNETPLQLWKLFLHVGTGIIFLFIRSQIHQCF